MKVLIANADPEDIAFFSGALTGCVVQFCSAAPDRPYPDVDIVAVSHQHPTGRAEIDFLPKVKLIVTRSTGFDLVDTELARDRGIAVCNVPEYGSTTVAEFTMALILSMTRHVPAAVDRCRGRAFSLEELQGTDIGDKRLGIVGRGKIGQHLAKIATGFGMTVIFSDPFWVGAIPFEVLIAQSDIVALCCPLTAATHHLMDGAAISKMRPGSYLVNTARGGVVDGAALLSAIESGHLAGAALDVLEGEEAIRDGVEDEFRSVNLALMQHPRVLVTPHVAFNTKEARQRIRQTTVEIIEAFVNGKVLHLIPV